MISSLFFKQILDGNNQYTKSLPWITAINPRIIDSIHSLVSPHNNDHQI